MSARTSYIVIDGITLTGVPQLTEDLIKLLADQNGYALSQFVTLGEGMGESSSFLPTGPSPWISASDASHSGPNFAGAQFDDPVSMSAPQW